MYQLAQRQASYVVVEERRPVIKEKTTQKLLTTPAPPRALENSIADVSLLAGLLIDKFRYHLPLLRQYQRITEAGIALSRSLITQLVAKAIALLKPIAGAQHQHVLQSKVLAIDETLIKAGRKGPGKMKRGYFWPIYGEDCEIVFIYCNSRSRKHLDEILGDFQGTLQTDGYEEYDRYIAGQEGIIHAQC